MDRDTAAAQLLARRLRTLRLQGLPEWQLTQSQLAEALRVSEPSVSAWENTKSPTVAPIRRLRAYAQLFARQTPPEGRIRLPDPATFTEAEKARQAELERELLVLRATALGEPIDGGAGQTQSPTSFEDFADLLLSQQSVIQQTLSSFEAFLATGSDEARSTAERLTRLLRAAPLLAGSTVLSDNELSVVEETEAWARVWSVSASDSIEFEYPAVGPSFAPIVLRNLGRGVQYRYLVPWSDRSIERAEMITSEYAEIEVRFLDDDYLREFVTTLDGLVVYESADPSIHPHSAYYLYPGSEPRRWITADRKSALNRLHDVRQVWKHARRNPQ